MQPEENEYVHLGDLELQVMDLLWQKAEPCAVGDIHEELLKTQKLAYTTVMTVMTNLHKKGLLERCKSGKAFLYLPIRKKDDIVGGMLSRIRDGLFRDRIPEFFSCFLKTQGSIQPQRLQELKAMLEELEAEK